MSLVISPLADASSFLISDFDFDSAGKGPPVLSLPEEGKEDKEGMLCMRLLYCSSLFLLWSRSLHGDVQALCFCLSESTEKNEGIAVEFWTRLPVRVFWKSLCSKSAEQTFVSGSIWCKDSKSDFGINVKEKLLNVP